MLRLFFLFGFCCLGLRGLAGQDLRWLGRVVYLDKALEGVCFYNNLGDTSYSDVQGRVSLVKRGAWIEATKAGFKVQRYPLGELPSLWTLECLPAYQLEVSLYDASQPEMAWSNLGGGARIEVYNRTLGQEVLVLEDYEPPFFSLSLEQGNEYLFMIRRKGYYTKRMKANVNINDCLLCLEGFGEINRGIVDNLSKHSQTGTLRAEIGIKPLKYQETVKIEDIYYDFGSAELRPEAKKALDKLAKILKDNPNISIELASHTDSRGAADKNLSLSQERAEKVVAYLVKQSKIDPQRLEAKGYGESQLVNKCSDEVPCTEAQHQQNRRTTFTILKTERKEDDQPSLRSIVQAEDLDLLLGEIQETYFQMPEPSSPQPLEQEVYQAFLLKAGQEPKRPELPPANFNGYSILIKREAKAPTLEHPVFKTYQQVYLDLDKTGQYLLLLGQFSSKEAAQPILLRVQEQYPQAKLLPYLQGQAQY